MTQLLTVAQVADRWQKDISTIKRYIKEGKLQPCKKVPGSMFREEYLDELEGFEFEQYSPLGMKRLMIENKRLQEENETLKDDINKIMQIVIKRISIT